MQIVFFGTPFFAVPILHRLLEGPDEVIAVVTQPDREKGRGRKVTYSPIKEVALRHGLQVFQPEKAKGESFRESLEAIHPDLFVVVAYGQILPKSLLKIPKYGALNVHASLLPRYRGAAPISWAILNGEKETGITTMMMDEGMDTGDILLQKAVALEKGETAETLYEKLASVGASLLAETVARMKEGSVHPVPQDPSKATYAPPLKKEDGKIHWQREAREIERQIRAFNPWPGAFTRWEGHFLKIFKGEVREGAAGKTPGHVTWVGTDFVEVATGKGSFLIKEVQLEGKKRMEVREFLAGHPMPVGTTLL